jgi:hypothetical protein
VESTGRDLSGFHIGRAAMLDVDAIGATTPPGYAPKRPTGA